MDGNDPWDAFGSDSDSDDGNDDCHDGNNANDFGHNPTTKTTTVSSSSSFESAALDATALSMTRHFASTTKSTGVSPRDRAVGIIDVSTHEEGGGSGNGRRRRNEELMAERVRGRGMKAIVVAGGDDDDDDDVAVGSFDAAVIMTSGGNDDGASSRVRRALLPGGSLWIVISSPPQERAHDDGKKKKKNGEAADDRDSEADDRRKNGPSFRIGAQALHGYSEAVWDVASASSIHSSSASNVIMLTKRSCTINAWSCPWMDKRNRVGRLLLSQNDDGNHMDDDIDGFAILSDNPNETYLEYERRAADAITISPSVAERSSQGPKTVSDDDEHAAATCSTTLLTDANVRRATNILRRHGVVVLRGLLHPAQTVPWGYAVLRDFEEARERLKGHPTRPVDLMNPHRAAAAGGGDDDDELEAAFEPLSYKELAMREDLRVDLRSGPEMERIRRAQNGTAKRSMTDRGSGGGGGGVISSFSGNDDSNDHDDDEGPSMIRADTVGTLDSWRFHPSLLAILRALFNPRDASLSKGNFGRWNFGGSGPDGSAQPFRLGQVGSVLSCPGSGDQAMHADTPHLFEDVDCLACHYCNVFAPGYEVMADNDDEDRDNNDDDGSNKCYRNEFDRDGTWTGNSTMGGTAFVHGSHRLSVSSRLLADDDDGDAEMTYDNADDGTSLRRRMLHLRTFRPALEAGDVLLFDCRTVHYGLANTSRGACCDGDNGGSGNVHAGRRPMLYLNVTQSWFHDPKNWDDREKIFE